MKKVIAPLSILALLLCIVSPMLLYVDQVLIGREGLRQMPWILAMAVFFFTYTFCSLLIFHKSMREKGNASPAYYMVDKAIRFLVCALGVAVYGFVVRDGILPFAVNLFVLYLVTMLFTNIYCIRQEKKYKK